MREDTYNWRPQAAPAGLAALSPAGVSRLTSDHRARLRGRRCRYQGVCRHPATDRHGHHGEHQDYCVARMTTGSRAIFNKLTSWLSVFMSLSSWWQVEITSLCRLFVEHLSDLFITCQHILWTFTQIYLTLIGHIGVLLTETAVHSAYPLPPARRRHHSGSGADDAKSLALAHAVQSAYSLLLPRHELSRIFEVHLGATANPAMPGR